VVLFQPAYDLYVPAIHLSGGTPVLVTLRPPDYHIDWDEVRRVITPRTRVIVINSPHNPTGMILGTEDIRELARVLEHTDAVVVADEAYEHIVFDGARHESLSRYPCNRRTGGGDQLIRQDLSYDRMESRLGGGPTGAQRRSPEHPPMGHVRGQWRDSTRLRGVHHQGPRVSRCRRLLPA
jgi:hypothetical protein